MFEDSGLARSTAAAASEPDEEFDYAFADGKREVLLLVSTNEITMFRHDMFL